MVSFRRRVRIAGAGFGVLHATQLIGHAARLLYLVIRKNSYVMKVDYNVNNRETK